MRKADKKSGRGKGIKLRTVFMGTSSLSETIFERLLKDGYNVVAAYTKPDMKVGRSQEVVPPPIKSMAEKAGVPVYQPQRFDAATIETFKSLKPDLVVVAAYGRILPRKILDVPGFGCVNVHVSLLPKFRGPSPVQNALLAGEKETGVTLMLMDEGVDTGDILVQETLPIGPHDNSKILLEKLAALGADVLSRTLPEWIDRKIEPKSQNHKAATFSQLIEREDGRIMWNDDAESIHDRFRALSPWPGIFTEWKTPEGFVRLKLNDIALLKTDPEQRHKTGEVFEIADTLGVQTGKGVIILKTIQRAGKKPTDAKSFKSGYPKFIGSVLV